MSPYLLFGLCFPPALDLGSPRGGWDLTSLCNPNSAL